MSDFLIRNCSIYKFWNDENLKSWRNLEQAGMLRFVIVEGFVKWGVWAMALFFIMYYSNNAFTLVSVLVNSLFWVIGSILYGSIYWVGTKRSYDKYREKNVGVK